jgi:hypothetical protein
MATTPEEQAGALSLNDLLKQQRVIINELNTETQKRLKLLAKVGELTDAEKTDLEEINKKITKATANQKIFQNEIKKVRDELKLQIGYYSNVESSISSLSSVMGSLNTDLKKATQLGIDFSKSIENSVGEQRESFKQANEAASLAISSIASLAQLNKEDVAQIAEYTSEYKNQHSIVNDQIKALNAAKKEGKVIDESALNVLEKQSIYMEDAFKKASKFANMQKDVKELYEEMNEELETGNKFFQKLINYGKLFFSSWKGAMTVIGFAAGYVADEFGKINAQIGGGFTQLVGFKSQLTAISLILGDEAVGAVTEFGARIGNVNKISNELAFDLGLLPTHLGVSGDEAGKLVNQFGNLQGQSSEVALNTLEATSQLAAANGVIPSQVMKDLASNTELAATYASGFGDNITKAAIDAARLGVDLETVGKISDGLLDYQSSVAAEMEASVLLGRNLNLQKARELAYADDIDGAMRAALDAAGGIDEFNKMDVFQKKAVAEAIGVSVGELKQMVTNMDEAQKPVGAMTASFNTMSSAVDYIGTTGFGKWIGAAGGFLTTIGQAGMGLSQIGKVFSQMGIDLGDIAKKTKEWIASLLKGSIASKSQFAGGSFSAGKELLEKSGRIPALPELPQTSVAGPLTKSGKPDMRYASNKSITTPTKTPSNPTAGISAGKILAIAAAMLAFAGAIYILSQAFAEFDKLQNVGQTLGVFTAAIVGMGLTIGILATVLAPLQPVILPLVGAMLAFGGAIALVGFGVNLAATGMAALVNSFSSLETNQLIAATVGVVGLSVAFYGLASSLTAVAAASTLALPVLGALAIGGLVGGVVGGLVGGGENDGLGEKIDALTTAIKEQPILLYLDNNVIARTVRKESAKTI